MKIIKCQSLLKIWHALNNVMKMLIHWKTIFCFEFHCEFYEDWDVRKYIHTYVVSSHVRTSLPRCHFKFLKKNLCAVSHVSHATYVVSHVTYVVSHVTYVVSHVTYICRVTCHICRVTCHICHICRVTCHICHMCLSQRRFDHSFVNVFCTSNCAKYWLMRSTTHFLIAQIILTWTYVRKIRTFSCARNFFLKPTLQKNFLGPTSITHVGTWLIKHGTQYI
jgi:hypothetical protein